MINSMSDSDDSLLDEALAKQVKKLKGNKIVFLSRFPYLYTKSPPKKKLQKKIMKHKYIGVTVLHPIIFGYSQEFHLQVDQAHGNVNLIQSVKNR